PLTVDVRVLWPRPASPQPVSNGLYASLGIVPRMPLFNLIGRPRDGVAWPGLPDGITAQRVVYHEVWPSDPQVHALYQSLLGFAHPEAHAFVPEEPRRCFA